MITHVSEVKTWTKQQFKNTFFTDSLKTIFLSSLFSLLVQKI